MAFSHDHREHELSYDTRRAKKRRRAQLWYAAGAAVLLILAGGAYYVLFASDAFIVESVSVSGNRFVSSDALREAVVRTIDGKSWLLKKLTPRSIWYWRLGDSVLEGTVIMPAVAHTDLSADITGHTAAIMVRERALAGVWCTDICMGFDEEGIAFFPAPDLSGTLILKVRDENPHALIEGFPVHPKADEVRTLLETVRAIKAEGVALTEAVVKEEVLGEWEARTARGSVFRFSLDFVPAHMGETLGNIASRARLEDLEYVDFRVPNRIYYR